MMRGGRWKAGGKGVERERGKTEEGKKERGKEKRKGEREKERIAWMYFSTSSIILNLSST